jgi:AI-2 transport system ATP-binding protein
MEYLVSIAKQYYEQGKTIDEIARINNISSEEVGLLLEEARQKNIVLVQVKEPLKTDKLLEDELASLFKLKAVRVLIRENRTYEAVLRDIGALGAQYFQGQIQTNSVVGISWGSALYHLINSIQPRSLPEVEVIQLIGAMGSENILTDGPILAQLLANRLGARLRYLHAPLVVESENTKEALLKERSIRDTLLRAENVTICLVGIGTTDPEFNSLLRAGYVSEGELHDLRIAGAIGDVCAQHYNANGEWLNIELNRRVVGVSPNVLRKCPVVIGVAAGPKKVNSILAALRGQYINVLITDDVTAQAILDKGRQKETEEIGKEISTEKKPVISLKGIWKVFSGVPVLQGVDIDLFPGEIHALLGGNGSGKSTLMKIVSGVYQPDAGAIAINNSPTEIRDPADGHLKGIYLVPQEPKVFPHLSVLENLLIGSDLRYEQISEKLLRLQELLGFDARLNEAAGTLNIANQQLLEILRGLIRDVRILILDEPTSTLTFREVDMLFQRMRLLRSEGIGIFFISHRLNEILQISDRVSVLRDGKLIFTEETSKLNTRTLIHAMLPEDAAKGNGGGAFSGRKFRAGKIILEVKSLKGEMFDDITLNIREGEIVGLAGLVGAGRTEFARALVGLEPNTTGEVVVDGKIIPQRNPEVCRKYGLVYMPEDRHAHGIFLERPSLETMTATVLSSLGKVFIDNKIEQSMGKKFVDQFRIQMTDLWQVAQTLSGGNQQKLLLAKSLASNPKVVILDEPTRGIDVKARFDVYRITQNLANEGIGILIISSDLEEIVGWCDRIYVMYHGKIIEELLHNECTMERVMSASFGVVEK